MLSMFLLGKFADRFDPRALVLVGLLLTAYSLSLMARFRHLCAGTYVIVSTGFLQGLGLGFVFVPLSTLAYLTLEPQVSRRGRGTV